MTRKTKKWLCKVPRSLREAPRIMISSKIDKGKFKIYYITIPVGSL